MAGSWGYFCSKKSVCPTKQTERNSIYHPMITEKRKECSFLCLLLGEKTFGFVFDTEISQTKKAHSFLLVVFSWFDCWLVLSVLTHSYVRIFLLQKKKESNNERKIGWFSWHKQNFVSFHLFFLFCNSFAFSFFHSFASTTTPTHVRFLFWPDSKKKTKPEFVQTKCLVLWPINHQQKKKQSWEILFPQQKHETQHTTHGRRRGWPAHLLIWGVLRVLLRHRFQCLIQHLKWSHLLFMFCIHDSKLGFKKWSSSIFNSILVIYSFQNMIDQFQNICGIWPNWFWNCFCCLTCQLTQHLTVFLSWKVVCCLFLAQVVFLWFGNNLQLFLVMVIEVRKYLLLSFHCFVDKVFLIQLVLWLVSENQKFFFWFRFKIFGPILFDLLSFKVPYFIWHSCQGLLTSDEEEQ